MVCQGKCRKDCSSRYSWVLSIYQFSLFQTHLSFIMILIISHNPQSHDQDDKYFHESESDDMVISISVLKSSRDYHDQIHWHHTGWSWPAKHDSEMILELQSSMTSLAKSSRVEKDLGSMILFPAKQILKTSDILKDDHVRSICLKLPKHLWKSGSWIQMPELFSKDHP